MDDKLLRELGVSRYGVIDTCDITFYPEIREICEGNVCGQYGKTWACPPGVGTLRQCREKCRSFSNALVFCGEYDIEDPFDIEGMRKGHGEFKKLCDRLFDAVKDDLRDFLLLSNEGCTRCRECTYPDGPCRMPERLFPSVEGFGINVSELAGLAGIPYKRDGSTVSYFGLLMYNE